MRDTGTAGNPVKEAEALGEFFGMARSWREAETLREALAREKEAQRESGERAIVTQQLGLLVPALWEVRDIGKLEERDGRVLVQKAIDLGLYVDPTDCWIYKAPKTRVDWSLLLGLGAIVPLFFIPAVGRGALGLSSVAMLLSMWGIKKWTGHINALAWCLGVAFGQLVIDFFLRGGEIRDVVAISAIGPAFFLGMALGTKVQKALGRRGWTKVPPSSTSVDMVRDKLQEVTGKMGIPMPRGCEGKSYSLRSHVAGVAALARGAL